jgi:hypothetical protein
MTTASANTKWKLSGAKDPTKALKTMKIKMGKKSFLKIDFIYWGKVH